MFEALFIPWLTVASPNLEVQQPKVETRQDAWALRLCGNTFMYVWQEQDGTLWLVTPNAVQSDQRYRDALKKMLAAPGMLKVVVLEEMFSNVRCQAEDETQA